MPTFPVEPIRVAIDQDLFGRWHVLTRNDAALQRGGAIFADRDDAIAYRRILTAPANKSSRKSPERIAAPPDPVAETSKEAEEIRRLVVEYGAAKRIDHASDNGGDADQPGLFPSNRTPELRAALVGKLLALLADNETVSGIEARMMVEQSISMMDLSRQNIDTAAVLRMAPRAMHAFLDYSVNSFFAEAPCRSVAVPKLRDAGIRRIGDIVQRSESEILRILGNPSHLGQLKARLSHASLCFGMRAPYWRKERTAA